MKIEVHIAMGALLVLCLQPHSASAADDPLEPYRVTQVTETVNYDSSGRTTGKDVVSDSKVDIKEKVVEHYDSDGHGNLRLMTRTTTTQDTQGKSVTTTEALVSQSATELVVTSVTTSTRDGAGGSITTFENRDASGNLVLNRRVTVTRTNGQTVTTVETLDKHGNFVVVSQTTTK